jgi:hypothetical protein
MGQRHQIYAVVQNEVGASKVIGIHHQWLYGRTALKLLINAIKLQENGEDSPYKVFSKGSANLEVLAFAYSGLIEEGYFHQVHPLGHDQTTNPNTGDNNDGITIISFLNEKPEYCFLSLEGSEHDDEVERNVPLSAEQYIGIYYPKDNKGYSEQDKKELEDEINGLLNYLKEFNVLTLNQVKEIFPALYPNKKSKQEVSA